MTLGFLYGLFSESIPFYGSRKKSYIVLMSIIQILSCLAIVFIPVGQTWSVQVVSTLLLISSMAICWNDTIVDGLIVVQQRRDPLHGSQDLQVFSYICLAFGGVVPNALAILLSLKMSLSACYVVPSIIGCAILASALMLSAEADKNNEEFMAMSLKKRL